MVQPLESMLLCIATSTRDDILRKKLSAIVQDVVVKGCE